MADNYRMTAPAAATPPVTDPVPLLERVRQHRQAIYSRKFVTGRSGRQLDIWPTGITQPSGNFLRDLVIREQARRTLEVGLGLGLSSLAIIEGILTVGGDVHHTTMDFAQAERDYAGRQSILDASARDVSTVMPKDSAVALAELYSSGKRFDFAFVDGSHVFDGVIVDLFYTIRLVKPDGLIVLDDHWMPAVQTALAFCTTNWKVDLELFDPEGPGGRLVAFRNNGKAHQRAWDHFQPFSRADLPAYPWRV